MTPELTAPGGRRLTYLRLSVTDLCNLRCRYCMPSEGVPKLRHEDILTYEEMIRLVRVGHGLGLRKLRLTGGEPLVRRGLLGFIRRLKDEGLIDDLRLTTNGVLLPSLARDLREAGLTSLNISLDALESSVYADMTGQPGPVGEKFFQRAWAGFLIALELGFNTKINCVPIRGLNDGQWARLAELTLKYPVEVRFIEHMPIGSGALWHRDRFVSAKELMEYFTNTFGLLTPVPPPDPSAPARLYRLPDAPGALGFISPLSGHFCGRCNRLRLTADGRLKPCLLTDEEIDLRGPLRAGADDGELAGYFRLAAGHKPISHYEARGEAAEGPGSGRAMSRIGG